MSRDKTSSTPISILSSLKESLVCYVLRDLDETKVFVLRRREMMRGGVDITPVPTEINSRTQGIGNLAGTKKKFSDR